MCGVGRHGCRGQFLRLKFGNKEFLIELLVLLNDALGFVNAEFGLGGLFDARGRNTEFDEEEDDGRGGDNTFAND